MGTKKGIIQNINLQYSVRGENRITTTDSLFFKKEMFDSAKTGLQHNIPISTNFKLFKFFSFSASTNFQETWVFKTVNKSYDQENQQEIVDETSGFDSFRTYNFSTSLGTTVYGMYNFSEKSKIKALRHVLRPSLSFGISPHLINIMIPMRLLARMG